MLKVIKAEYGGKDVKDIVVNKWMKDNTIILSVNNDTFEGDPMAGVSKKFDIVLDDNGTIIEYTANEGENYSYPKQKYLKENTLIVTSCNRISQVLFAIAVNKEIIKEDFNLVVVDCSTPHLSSEDGIKMHISDDPYNLVKEHNYNPNWNQLEDYIKTINKIKQYRVIHVNPRMSKQIGEANLIALGMTAASLMGSKYSIKLTGVCHLKYDIFTDFKDKIGESPCLTWRRTGFYNQKSTRVFAGRSDKLASLFVESGYAGWVKEYDFLERKFERILDENFDNNNHADWDERDIIVDEGVARTDHRKVLYENLEKHGLLDSEDVYIKAFIEGGIWQ